MIELISNIQETSLLIFIVTVVYVQLKPSPISDKNLNIIIIPSLGLVAIVFIVSTLFRIWS